QPASQRRLVGGDANRPTLGTVGVGGDAARSWRALRFAEAVDEEINHRRLKRLVLYAEPQAVVIRRKYRVRSAVLPQPKVRLLAHDEAEQHELAERRRHLMPVAFGATAGVVEDRRIVSTVQ